MEDWPGSACGCHRRAADRLGGLRRGRGGWACGHGRGGAGRRECSTAQLRTVVVQNKDWVRRAWGFGGVAGGEDKGPVRPVPLRRERLPARGEPRVAVGLPRGGAAHGARAPLPRVSCPHQQLPGNPGGALAGGGGGGGGVLALHDGGRMRTGIRCRTRRRRGPRTVPRGVPRRVAAQGLPHGLRVLHDARADDGPLLANPRLRPGVGRTIPWRRPLRRRGAR